jgi:hypothetical protein
MRERLPQERGTMAQRQVLVRRLPPNPANQTGWRLYARNLANGEVKMIDLPNGKIDEGLFKLIIWQLLPDAWINPEWTLDYDTNARKYTVEV